MFRYENKFYNRFVRLCFIEDKLNSQSGVFCANSEGLLSAC